MAMEQEKEWAEAQKITISIDLVTASKNQIKFVAAVDRNRHLYKGPAMEWAIYRYNAYWLPLLAKHLENPISDEPIVVPLDCEWIWHCHRLSPVTYKADCQKLFGKVLGNHNIISSIHGTSKSKTEEIWNKMYPEEPYELDPNRQFPDLSQKNIQSENFTNYDLVAAVGRKTSFSYQVSKPYWTDDLFLQEALARYKGFLHMIKTNKMNNIKRFCVPTYDVDLMWHSHQLNAVAYCKDSIKLMGFVLQHDDTESDRTKGAKLDTGFFATTKQFEETFGLNYWKAGGMYKGATPTPVVQFPIPFISEGNKFQTSNILDSLLISLSKKKCTEVLLEFVEVKNLPESHKENFHVLFSKNRPDILFNAKGALTVQSQTKEKQVAFVQCEPTGEFLFELANQLPSETPSPKAFKPFGYCSLSFEECFASRTQLFINKWIPVVPKPEILVSEPILLHVSLSFTTPTPAQKVFQLLHSHSCFKCSSCSPVSKIANDDNNAADDQTRVVDDDGNIILNIQMSMDVTKSTHDKIKEVIHITNSGETHTLAKFQGNEWVIEGSHGSLKLHCTPEKDGHLFELVGEKMVRLFTGRKLDYQPKEHEKQRSDDEFMTAIEFSVEYPYGRAVALIDFKHGILKVMDEWMILYGITSAFILSDILRREGSFTAKVAYEDIMSTDATKISCGNAVIEGGYDGGKKNDSGDMISGNCGSTGCCNNCVDK